MIICCDTSFLVSLYGNDVHFSSALEYIKFNQTSLTLTPFNYFEFYSTLHLSEFRKKFSKEDVLFYIDKLEKDLLLNFFREPHCDLEDVLREARKLSSY